MLHTPEAAVMDHVSLEIAVTLRLRDERWAGHGRNLSVVLRRRYETIVQARSGGVGAVDAEADGVAVEATGARDATNLPPGYF